MIGFRHFFGSRLTATKRHVSAQARRESLEPFPQVQEIYCEEDATMPVTMIALTVVILFSLLALAQQEKVYPTLIRQTVSALLDVTGSEGYGLRGHRAYGWSHQLSHPLSPSSTYSS